MTLAAISIRNERKWRQILETLSFVYFVLRPKLAEMSIIIICEELNDQVKFYWAATTN